MKTKRPSLCSVCGRRKVGRCDCRPTRYDTRQSAHRRGYDHRWRAASLAFLARPENRICNICNDRLSECVDHIIDHHGDKELFWDVENWQPACIPCNTRKAQRK
jgi:5-methylcytosine-specific restriction enzyme A